MINLQKKEEYEVKGLPALESRSPFDQAAILMENEDYILNALGIYRLKIVHTDDDGVDQAHKDNVCPLAPIICYLAPTVGFS